MAAETALFRNEQRTFLRPSAQEAGMLQIDAQPYPFNLTPASAAFIIIDMQRDFLEPGGFGAALGNDVSRLQAAIAPCKNVLEAVRAQGLLVIHTREGHRPDLADAPPYKVER